MSAGAGTTVWQVLGGLFLVGVILHWATGPSDREQAKAQARNASPLEMMQVVFVGNHPASAIERQVRRAARAYNLSETEQNFSRMGSALVAVRESSGVTEMELLRCAAAMGEEVLGTGIRLDFPSAVGMCAASLH